MRAMKNSGVEWIGEIPLYWSIGKVSYFFRVELGKMLQPQQISPTDTLENYLCAVNVGNNILKTDTFKQMWFTEAEKRVMSIRKGDLIVVEGGDVASSAIIEEEMRDVYYQNALHRVRGTGQVDSRILRYLLMTAKAQGHIDLICNKATIAHFSKDKFKSLPCILAPKPEQSRIADYLDAKCAQIDTIIEKQQQVIEKLKAYKQSIITEAVTKGLDPTVPMKDSGVEWIGKVPASWVVCRYGKVASVKSNLVSPVSYSMHPQISPETIEKGTGKLLEYKTVEETGVISWNHLFFKGQILYSKIRPTLNKVVIAPFDGLCSADMYPIETENNTQFVVYMMLSHYFLAQVGLVVENRVKMPKINQSELAQVVVAMPPLPEQKEIAEFLSKRCEMIDSISTKRQSIINKLTDYKKSLIYEAVTGKMEV